MQEAGAEVCAFQERPGTGPAHRAAGCAFGWEDGSAQLPPGNSIFCSLLEGVGFVCLLDKAQSGDFYRRNSCGIQSPASCQPSPAHTTIMRFIQQHAFLAKT